MENLRFNALTKPFIIAEMSGNHNQSLERALRIVDAAAEAGVDAIKLQTYTADTMTLDLNEGDFFISNPQSPWCGLICFSTPFDATAVDFLEELGAPCYKIASFENTDLPLIRKVAQTGKPLIVSTGMATVADLDELVRTARENGCRDITLLKCTSSYPATPAGSNILTIPHMKALFGCNVGLSDHTLGIGAAVASIALGATVIEKHFTLARADGGVDSAFSMEPEEMALLVRECRTAWEALGEISYNVQAQEEKSLIFRRSLYIVEDMKAGDVITEGNMRAIRPGYGLSPRYYDVLLGRRVGCNVRRGTPLSWELLS